MFAWLFPSHALRLEAAILREQLAAANVAHARAQQQADYWRVRCEKLTDAALSRAHAISGPTMRDIPLTPSNPLQAAFRGLGVTEIDSGGKEPRDS